MLKNNKNGLCGLQNYGNTCWLNSSIQCLIKTKLMNHFFCNLNKNKYLNNDTILSIEWVRLTKGINEDSCIISPLSFLKSIIKSAEKNKYIFDFSRQNDVHEFITFFIDSLHEELKRKVTINITGEIKNNLDKMAFEAMKYWKKYFKNNYSEIIDMFYGQLVSQIMVIENVNIKSYSYNPINIFSLPIPNSENVNIYDCFDLFTEDQILDNDNKWKNEEDNKYYDVIKSLKVWKFPKILIVHLKRFKNNINKINQFVDIPLDNLDLRKYCIGYDKNDSIYSLYGVCNHIGNQDGGHYYSYCKFNDEWYKFDDINVLKIKDNKIITKNAYLLFFEKK